jgi:lactate permease
MMTRFFGRRKKWTTGLSMAPFAIFAGLAFTVPYTLTAIYVGPEYPSLVGGLVGMAITVTAARLGFLIPHHHKWDFKSEEEWESNWSAGGFKPDTTSDMPPWVAWMPIVILAILVAITQIPSPVSEFFQTAHFEKGGILGTPVTISGNLSYWPSGLMLFAAILVIIVVFRLGVMKIAGAFVGTCGGGWAGIINWTFIMPMMSIYIYSSINSSNMPGMLQILAHWFAQIPGGQIWGPIVAPTLGAIGGLFAESNTLSNMMMASFQHDLAFRLGIPTTIFMSLQMAGAGAGNMLAMHYLVRSAIPVGMLGWEGPMARQTVIPTIWYVAILAILGIIAIHFLQIEDPLLINGVYTFIPPT